VQEVLHADWQEVWHSPHPPFFMVFCNLLVFNVLMCFIVISPFKRIPAQLLRTLLPAFYPAVFCPPHLLRKTHYL
jgi:hypothetical protein